MHASDIDVDHRLEIGPTKIASTMASYAAPLKKFAEFVEADPYVPYGPMIPKKYFTDDLIAAFLIYLGDKHNHGPHILKTASAALGYAMEILALPNFRDFKHEYPKTTLALAVINETYNSPTIN